MSNSKIKNFNEYIKKSILTESVILSIDVNTRMLHGVLGVSTEISELTETLFEYFTDNKKLEDSIVNIKEEIGDIYWYMSILLDEYDTSFINISQFLEYDGFSVSKTKDINAIPETEDKSKLMIIFMNLNFVSSTMLDKYKKHIFYKKEINIHDLFSNIIKLNFMLLTLLDYFNLDISEILELNLNKLAKRYNKGSFSIDNAINRDIKNELSHY